MIGASPAETVRRRLAGGMRVLSADCERRERQREKKNDERCAYGQTARSAFFRGVEPEAAQNARAARGADTERSVSRLKHANEIVIVRAVLEIGARRSLTVFARDRAR